MKDYLHTCCLDFPLDTPCMTLSGGERHRVFIAIYLSLLPKILMLDEPTAALDEQTAHTLIQNLKTFYKEKDITLIIVCHNRTLAEQYADYIITLEMRKRI